MRNILPILNIKHSAIYYIKKGTIWIPDPVRNDTGARTSILQHTAQNETNSDYIRIFT
jgi:hypothetical protein